MVQMELGEVQERFAKIVWENAPIPSGELAKLCEKELNWKKSTTYTVLKKLCDRGIFANEDGVVRSLYNKEQFYAAQSRQYVDEAFEGSLPAFMAAFSSGRRLSEKDVKEIRALLDSWEGGMGGERC